MAEKFLVLGASSFYGRNFADLVENRGGEVVRWRHYYNHLEPCDYIVNFASKSLVAESWDHPLDWVAVNVGSLSILLGEMQRDRRFKKFVHVSTPEVYGSTDNWVDESHTNWQPSTPYAVSRAAGDMMLKAYHKAYGFPAVITRTANIYGEGQQDYRLIPKAQRYKKEGKTLPLHGNGQSRRSFIHVGDAVNALYLLCCKGMPGETYHISTREAHSIREVVDLIGCKYEVAPDRLGKDEAYLLDSTKLRDMGWSDTIKLEDWICASQT